MKSQPSGNFSLFYKKTYRTLTSATKTLDFSNQNLTSTHLWHICQVWKVILNKQKWPASVRELNLNNNLIGLDKAEAVTATWQLSHTLSNSSHLGLQKLMNIIFRTGITRILLANNSLSGTHIDIIATALRRQSCYYLEIDLSSNPINFYSRNEKNFQDVRPVAGVNQLFRLVSDQEPLSYLSIQTLPTLDTVTVFGEECNMDVNKSFADYEKIRTVRPIVENRKASIQKKLHNLTDLFKKSYPHHQQYRSAMTAYLNQTLHPDSSRLVMQYLNPYLELK